MSGFLVEDGALLCVKQRQKDWSYWNIPGGALEAEETLEQGIRREFLEETGLVVEIACLLYLCDRVRTSGRCELDISFLLRRVGGSLKKEYTGDDGEMLVDMRFIPISQLTDFGFAPEFQRIAANGFPNRGEYKGDFHAFYGRSRQV